MLQLDLSTLSNEKLLLLREFAPQDVEKELTRREAFETLSEAFTSLAEAALELENYLESKRQTPAVRDIKKLDVVRTIRRALATAQIQGIPFDYPEIETILGVVEPIAAE